MKRWGYGRPGPTREPGAGFRSLGANLAFRSQTDDNGTNINVTGKADGTNFIINSSTNGNLSAPEQVHPSNPWAPFVLQTDVMMSTKTGKISPVIVKDTGEGMVTFDGRTMKVHQWFVDDEKHQVVWIDERGVVVAFQTEEQGSAINFAGAKGGS